MAVNILHISDLHRDPGHPLTNVALLDSLVRDRDRYAAERPGMKGIDLIVVSGDLVNGVRPTDADAPVQLDRQYAEAGEFLSELAKAFVGEDHNRVVLVPGNHDVSYIHFLDSLKETPPSAIEIGAEISASRIERLHDPGSTLRWSWQSLCFYDIVDQNRYLQRLEPFANFYQEFYGGTRSYSLDPGDQFDIFDYPELGVSFAVFNSCHDNDPFNRVAHIHPDCIAGASQALRAERFRGRLRVAVWHHSVSSAPGQIDHLDPGTLQVLIDCGFSLGFHGHQHKPEFIEERFVFGEDRKITVISAGTLCGGPGALPSGRSRSYNLVEIDADGLTGTLHVREMQNDSFESPIWALGSLRSSLHGPIEFKIQEPPFRGNPNVAILADAEAQLTAGDPQVAIELAKPLIETSDLARKILIEALVAVGDTKSIAGLFYPPQSSAETVYVADALWEEKDARLEELINSQIVQDSTEPALVEIRTKYAGRIKQ